MREADIDGDEFHGGLMRCARGRRGSSHFPGLCMKPGPEQGAPKPKTYREIPRNPSRGANGALRCAGGPWRKSAAEEEPPACSAPGWHVWLTARLA